MWCPIQHKSITSILKNMVSDKALELIKFGNVESDKGTGAANHVQHFHYSSNEEHTPDPVLVMRRSSNYVEKCVRFASLCAYGDEGVLRMGLYFFGRGAHCAQDFFAHSNGVAINFMHPLWVLQGKTPPRNLSFCLPTGGGKVNMLVKNVFWRSTARFKDDVFDNMDDLRTVCQENNINPLKLGRKDRKKLAFVLAMRKREPLPHPDMNLDHGKTMAHRALNTILHRGYKEAETEAQKITKYVLRGLKYGISSCHLAVNSPEYRKLRFALRQTGYAPINLDRVQDTGYRRARKSALLHYLGPTKLKNKEKENMRAVFDHCLGVGKPSGQALERVLEPFLQTEGFGD